MIHNILVLFLYGMSGGAFTVSWYFYVFGQNHPLAQRMISKNIAKGLVFGNLGYWGMSDLLFTYEHVAGSVLFTCAVYTVFEIRYIYYIFKSIKQ